MLNMITKIRSLLDAHAGGTSHVKFEAAAVNAGEEVLAQPGNQDCERAKTARKERNQE